MDPYAWILSNVIENNMLGSAASVFTIITVIVSVKKHFDAKNKEKITASQNLCCELEDTLRSLDDKKFSKDFCHV